MSAISQRDHEAVLDCIGRLYECDSFDRFPRLVLTEILKLVSADSSTFNYVAPTIPKVVTVATPAIPDHEARTVRFAKLLPQHTVLRNYLATGNPGAFKFSDFQSEREYHRLPLYQEFYRELSYEDQLTFMLFPPGSEIIGISLARTRRNFTERDRRILNLLQARVARAYRHVERLDRLERHPGLTGNAESQVLVASILLDASNRPVHFSDVARRWLDYFFADNRGDACGLPPAVMDWLQCALPSSEAHPSVRHCTALIRERDGQRLRISEFPCGTRCDHVLVLSIETIASAAYAVRPGGLTRRETEVLLQVEQGKTNDETAAALGISPLTVRHHLEHIFEKLRVTTRTAAVTQFRRLCLRNAGIER